MSNEQVKFYRGNFEKFKENQNPEADNRGEIIFINDAIENE